jgi:phage tail sheath protein FI
MRQQEAAISFEHPGVYYQHFDADAGGISPVRTDVPGFVGIARRGPLNMPIPIESWKQFQAYFGEYTGAGYLAYAVRAFFENSGERCWAVRVASEAAQTAELTLPFRNSSLDHLWRIQAFSPGVWGNDLEIAIVETHRAQTRTVSGSSMADYSHVATTSGFERGDLVRLTQDGQPPQWKVIAAIDPFSKRLYWRNRTPENRLSFESALSGLDANNDIVIESVEYTIAITELGQHIAMYEGLSVVPAPGVDRYGPRVLHPIKLDPQAPRRTLPDAPAYIVITDERPDSLTTIEPLELGSGGTRARLAGGYDGLAALGVRDFVGGPTHALASDAERKRNLRGLRTFDFVDEIASVAIPDIHIQPDPPPQFDPRPPCYPNPCLPPPTNRPATPRQVAIGDMPPRFSESDIFRVQAAMVRHCELRKDRVAILDAPYASSRDDQIGIGAIREWRSRFDSKYAALYYPWIRVFDPNRSSTTTLRDIPVSGHVAGQIALAETTVGVHKAPANELVNWAVDVTVAVDQAKHGLLNSSGINVVKSVGNNGLRILGARTVSSDPDWRYLSVRRVMIALRRAIQVALQWLVFEPNNELTRNKVRLTLTNFLLAHWQLGTLVGETADQAFFVRCDTDLNTSNDISNGRLIADIGVAPSTPYEFILVRVGRVGNSLEISESDAVVM